MGRTRRRCAPTATPPSRKTRAATRSPAGGAPPTSAGSAESSSRRPTLTITSTQGGHVLELYSKVSIQCRTQSLTILTTLKMTSGMRSLSTYCSTCNSIQDGESFRGSLGIHTALNFCFKIHNGPPNITVKRNYQLCPTMSKHHSKRNYQLCL